MNAIILRPVREDADTVTLHRSDFEALMEALGMRRIWPKAMKRLPACNVARKRRFR